MIETWFARTWIVIIAAFVAFLAYASIKIIFIAVNQWKLELNAWNSGKTSKVHPEFSTSSLIASIVSSVLLFVMLGIMNVGQATALMSDDKVLAGLAWLYVAVLFPLITGKTMNKFSADKYGNVETSSSSTTTTTSEVKTGDLQ